MTFFVKDFGEPSTSVLLARFCLIDEVLSMVFGSLVQDYLSGTSHLPAISAIVFMPSKHSISP